MFRDTVPIYSLLASLRRESCEQTAKVITRALTKRTLVSLSRHFLDSNRVEGLPKANATNLWGDRETGRSWRSRVDHGRSRVADAKDGARLVGEGRPGLIWLWHAIQCVRA